MSEKAAEYRANAAMADAFAVGYDLAGLGEYRLAERMTELAHEDGLTELVISHDQVNRWRRGTRIVPAWGLDLVAGVVDVSVDELIARAKGRPTIEAQRARRIKETQAALEKIKAILGRETAFHARAV